MVGDYGPVQSWQTTYTPTGPSTRPQQDAVRESLRVALFRKWRDSARRDASCGHACPYAAKRTATAGKAAMLSAHRPAVLTGTAISPACYRQMARRKPAEDPCVEQLLLTIKPTGHTSLGNARALAVSQYHRNRLRRSLAETFMNFKLFGKTILVVNIKFGLFLGHPLSK